MKHVYEVDDGEHWYIVATSADEALHIGIEHYDIYYDADVVEVTTLPDDFVFRVNDNERKYIKGGEILKYYPAYPVYHYYGNGGWYCEATCKEWAAFSDVGDLIASSIF